jgi:hypothetical protein
MGSASRLVINHAEAVSNIAVPMLEIVVAVQITANARWLKTPNCEGTGLPGFAVGFALALNSVSVGSRDSWPVDKEGGDLLVQRVRMIRLAASSAYSPWEKKMFWLFRRNDGGISAIARKT